MDEIKFPTLEAEEELTNGRGEDEPDDGIETKQGEHTQS